MSTAAADMAGHDDDSVRRIGGVLRGPVIDICQSLIPELRTYSRREAYERVMDTPRLAALCFAEFRQNPEPFQPLLVGPNGIVIGDDQPLACGKTLADIIALIVRAVAKRHFRTRLDAPRCLVEPRRPSLFQSFAGWFSPPPSPKPQRKASSRGDALYRALRDHLLFEWQVLLIPYYARIPLGQAQSLGPRLLELREAEHIQEYIASGNVPEATQASDVPAPGLFWDGIAAPPSELRPAVPPDTQAAAGPAAGPTDQSWSPLAEAMWVVSQKLKLADLFNNNQEDMRRLVIVASEAGPAATNGLLDAGLRPQWVVVALCTFAHSLGRTRMLEFFGPYADGGFVELLVPLLGGEGMAALETAAQVKATIERVLKRLNDAVLLERAGWSRVSSGPRGRG
jgi:hypothetical protein